MNEDELIRELLRPLSADSRFSFGLTDDAALMPQDGAGKWLVSTDLLTEGVHFLPDDPPTGLAAKALRCNLSDLAAMGAEPVAAVFSLVRPPHWDESFLRGLIQGLGEDLHRFGVQLLGGDIATGALGVLSFTVWGRAHGSVVLRSGASTGETVWVSGTIGDSRLGLALLRGEDFVAQLSQAQKDLVVARYRCPEPRLALGLAVANHATAMLDVSDGLLLDAERLAQASQVSLEINAGQVPLSEAGQAVADNNELLIRLLGGGDDYELLFTAPLGCEEVLRAVAQEAKTAITPIGKTIPQQDKPVALLDAQGSALPYDSTASGWLHF